MMFSAEKCSDRSMGTSEEKELQTGGGEGLGKEGVPPDEVASAVAAVSEEIGDILKDELGDADRADRIGAELAGLSAELGLLAGLADGEPRQNFPTLFEMAIGHRGSASGTSSSSSWSGARARPQRQPRRRPIAKGKEISRRRSAAARRAASMRVRRIEVVSDASDVGADSDSDGQWTELEDACTSDNSSSKEQPEFDAVCNGYENKAAEAEPPSMGQFLLPLLSAEPERCELYIRHEDILQAVRLAPLHFRVPTEDCDGTPLPPEDDFDQADSLPLESDFKEPPVTPEEEAALLKYVTETQNIPNSEQFTPVPEWLLGVYHAWCEISALMYTLLGANMSVDMVREDWVYRARFGCHCRLCLCLANNAESLARWLLCVLTALHADTTTVPTAVALMRALNLPATAPPARPVGWRLARLKNLDVPPQGLAIIYEHLLKLEKESEMTRDIVNYVCVCRPILGRLKKKNAMERLCMILENFKAASVITFEVDILPSCSSSLSSLACSWRAELGEYLRPLQRCSSAARLRDMLARAPPPLNAWTGYKHKCDCLNPRAVCAQQRKMLLRISFFGMMQGVNEISAKPEETVDAEKAPSEEPVEAGSRELQQGDGTGAKPPDNTEGQPASVEKDEESDKSIGDLDDLSDSDGGSGSLGLSSSSLDSASELLLAAAAAVESGSEDAAAGSLCRTVRHLMRSIAHIERLMDRVLKHCDEWPGAASCRREADADDGARKKVDLGLSEVDRKLMAMYRRLPDVHRRQLQLYRKQKKLSTVCMQLVGGRAPAPPPPGSPPPAPAHQACRALCPEYHLRRFQEVRRKVMHMRDQQLYYHRLRMWLEEQLRYDKDRDRDSLPDSNSEDAPRSRRLSARQRRKLSSRHTHRILQLLRQPPHTLDDDEVDPPEAFPLSRDDTSGGETVVGERDELCREMRECLAKFADVALGRGEGGTSPPLQEMSPTSSEPPKPNQRLLQVNKYLPRDDTSDFQSQTPELLNAPINARRPLDEPPSEPNDPNVYRYVAFGMEINKAMEECQNIINSYNSINDDKEEDLSLTEFCEAMMNLDTKSSSKQIKADPERQRKMNSAYSKLVEVVENMPQILANMPEVATKLKSDIANAAFELPEFASIMNSLPEVNNEAQLTPETLKQIRELKLSKNKDNVKVTKNTAKRKANRRIKNNINHDDILGTMTLELDSKDINDLLKDDNDLHALMKSKSSKDDFKDLLFSISAQVVINKVFEYLKQNKSPELAKCLEEDKDLFNLPKSTINSEMYSKASTLFDNSVKDALSMDELRELVKTRFISWKQYVATKFRGIPVDLLEKEIEAMLDKFYIYIKDLAGKQNANDSDKIIEKIEELQESKDDNESKDPKGKSLLSFISPDEKMSVKSLKFKYMDVIKLCTESAQLTTWILLNPEMASNVIEELTGLPSETVQNVPDFSSVSLEEKKQYFINRLKAMNKTYMETLPKEVLSGDEWLVMLYRLENLEGKIRESLSKVTTNPKLTDLNHADFLLYKAIGIIIYDIKNNDAKPEEKQESLPSLLPSFNAIKSYITQGQAMSETHKNEIVSICSSINTKLIDETVQESKVEDDKEKPPLSVVGSQNPELLAKYSAQALRNAKQTLNEVAFRNMMRNGQTKSESDACDTPKSDCKWTNDCVCNSCKDDASVCTEKHVFDDKKVLEEKKEVKPAKTAAKAKPKVCENASHQQHVCKVGHANGPSACAGEGAPDSPCTCCYCTVFGHAPPLTTPVPRNFNETRERLRSILNKKKQKCKTNNATNGEPESPTPEPQPPRPKPVPAPPAPKPPFVFQALPKTLPPAPAPPAPAPAPAPAPRPEPVQRPPPMQVNVQNTLKTEGKVNPAAMEQIRLQQLKIQQMQAQQWSVPQPTAQHKPEPIYDLPIHNKPPQPQQQTQQTLQQQQQQLLQQLQQKQRMSRPAQPRAHASVSSRDTSVFSTSSGCSGITSHSGSCWRGHQDPRDLDALLQYIEGPARRVDRGKKRAKKLRQKGKKLEARLLEEHGALAAQLNRMRAELRAMQARQAACVRQCAEAEAQLRQQQAKRKGKKQKMNPAQQAQAQLIAEKLGELNALNKLTAKEVATAERQVADFAARFEECERQLAAARALQGAAPRPAPAAPAAPTTNERHLETATMLHRQQLQLQQQQLQQQFANLSASDKMDKQKQKAFLNVHGASARRNMESAPVQLIHNGRHLTVLNANIKPPKPQSPPRKQTWEQALAHINQLAKGSGKEKKKQKEPEKPKVEPKKPQEPQRSQSLPDSQPLSKKQRKLLAKQQAEEEERKRQQQLQQQQKAEARAKKEKERKPEPKPEPKRAEKPKKTEPVKEEKSKKKEKKEKQERTAPPPVPAPTPKQTKQQTKKEKKEQNKQNQVINITADTTIEVVNKKGGCGSASETPSSCSIMEQLSCGVQVSDLRLPPGITLTRVQPNEKKEPPPIKSVPLWKAGALPATPTPVARPAPVINADPSMMMFSAAQPEQPKTIILPEPAPPQPGRSKKAKKKAKKTAAAEAPPKPEPTKMVTLRNPMFHPNLPPANPVKKPEIRIPDPIPMPPNACQATITPTSNGMYTIRNPLMSMMHQQNMMGMNQQQTPMYGQQYNYVNPNTYTPVQTAPTPQAYVLEQRNSPKQDEFQNRIMNLASFTQKNEEGYSLFKTSDDNQQRNFLTPEYYIENSSPKPTVSPNPIGTRPNNDSNRSFDSNDSSLFTNPIKPEPIGTPLKQENDYAGLYTPFGQEDRNVFRNALFNDNNVPSYGKYDDVAANMMNGDPLPYFQRLRVGSKLNNEVSIHPVTESKFYKAPEPMCEVPAESLFSRGWPVYPREQTE